MRRLFAAVLALALCLPLAACGKTPQNTAHADGSEAQSVSASAQQNSPALSEGADLTPVKLANGGMPRDAENGFYRAETPYFDNEQYMTFYDYNTLTQRFVCTLPGCTHRDESCEAYVGNALSTYVTAFVVADKLYYIRNDFGGEQSEKAAVEQRGLDGSGVKVLATGSIFADLYQQALYTDGLAVYGLCNAGEGQTLTRLDLTTGEVTNQSIATGGSYNFSGGCYGRSILSVQYEGESTVKTDGFSVGVGADAMLAPSTLYAVNVDDGTRTLLHTFEKGVCANCDSSKELFDNKIYCVDAAAGMVFSYDVATDVRAPITDAVAPYAPPVAHDWAKERPDEAPEINALMQRVRPVTYSSLQWVTTIAGDWLFVHFYDETVSPSRPRKFACNLQTGETKEVIFTDSYNGAEYAMATHALTPHGLLVTQEHRTVPLETLPQEAREHRVVAEYEVFGLIALDDFVNNVPNFRTIEPIKYGAR